MPSKILKDSRLQRTCLDLAALLLLGDGVEELFLVLVAEAVDISLVQRRHTEAVSRFSCGVVDQAITSITLVRLLEGSGRSCSVFHAQGCFPKRLTGLLTLSCNFKENSFQVRRESAKSR
jgi:hypothetical protein